MKPFRLCVVAGSRHAALNICSVDPKAALDTRVSQPRVRSRVRNRFSGLALGTSVVWGLCAATSLHAQSAPHGDHNPHHGGVVLMYGLDLHYEIVLTPAGNVELWLSNAVREDLPASVVADVAAEIERAGARRNIDMAISDTFFPGSVTDGRRAGEIGERHRACSHCAASEVRAVERSRRPRWSLDVTATPHRAENIRVPDGWQHVIRDVTTLNPKDSACPSFRSGT
jgi:hypothetical protein